ncbi:MAG: hypothetical protein WCY18_06440 [Methanofastidiosum sp.]
MDVEEFEKINDLTKRKAIIIDTNNKELLNYASNLDLYLVLEVARNKNTSLKTLDKMRKNIRQKSLKKIIQENIDEQWAKLSEEEKAIISIM